MHEVADEREATRSMEGEKPRRQVDVVFGIGQALLVPQAARDRRWRIDEIRRTLTKISIQLTAYVSY